MNRIVTPKLIDPGGLNAFLVAPFDGFIELVFRDRDVEMFFQSSGEGADLSYPHIKRAFIVGDVRQVDDLHGLQFSKKLVHLFLAVAGSFSYYDVGKICIWAAFF